MRRIVLICCVLLWFGCAPDGIVVSGDEARVVVTTFIDAPYTPEELIEAMPEPSRDQAAWLSGHDFRLVTFMPDTSVTGRINRESRDPSRHLIIGYWLYLR